MLSPHLTASLAIPGRNPGSRRRAPRKSASGGLTRFRHPRAYANPRPACISARKSAEGVFHSTMDKLDYGLSEPKLALLKNGSVFVAGQVQAPMEPPVVQTQTQGMMENRSMLLDVVPTSTTLTVGSALQGLIVAQPSTRLIVIDPRPTFFWGYNFNGSDWGHVALWVSRNGHSKLYDFGRYRPETYDCGTRGPGILRVWNGAKSVMGYLNHENQYRDVTIFTMKTSESEENAMIGYFNGLISNPITTREASIFRVELENDVDIYRTAMEYQAFSVSCVTTSKTSLLLGLDAGGICIGEGFTTGEKGILRTYLSSVITPVTEINPAFVGMKGAMEQVMNQTPGLKSKIIEFKINAREIALNPK
jgi:hypothetical protein